MGISDKDFKIDVLTGLQLKIEGKSIIDYDEALYDGISISEINDIIQNKINVLKEEK